MKITILCRVVDNFGDIGVMLRLAKRLLAVSNHSVQINVVIDDLVSFSKINNLVDAKKNFQIADELNIYNWNDYDFCHSEFSKNDGENLGVILELFQCGRPDWLEKILFEEKLERTVQIVMIDYLTAEKYADDFHKLESLTRSKKVQKVNFMPGFTQKTGGLVIDSLWENLPLYDSNGPALVFTYERNWLPLANALQKSDVGKVFVAQGRGKDSFVESWKKVFVNKCEIPDQVRNDVGSESFDQVRNDVGSESFDQVRNDVDGDILHQCELSKLSYLNQSEWDKMMQQCSVLFIRGEESMSRACLSGIPFVWHAYPQSDEYQMVKVNALLERMQPHFTAGHFKIVRDVWLDFNLPENEVNQDKMEKDIALFLENKKDLQKQFADFALSLHQNGDLAKNLWDFICNFES